MVSSLSSEVPQTDEDYIVVIKTLHLAKKLRVDQPRLSVSAIIWICYKKW